MSTETEQPTVGRLPGTPLRLEHLPSELLDLIADELHSRYLKPLSLVDKAWKERAQRRLFARYSLWSKHNYPDEPFPSDSKPSPLVDAPTPLFAYARELFIRINMEFQGAGANTGAHLLDTQELHLFLTQAKDLDRVTLETTCGNTENPRKRLAYRLAVKRQLKRTLDLLRKSGAAIPIKKIQWYSEGHYPGEDAKDFDSVRDTLNPYWDSQRSDCEIEYYFGDPRIELPTSISARCKLTAVHIYNVSDIFDFENLTEQCLSAVSQMQISAIESSAANPDYAAPFQRLLQRFRNLRECVVNSNVPLAPCPATRVALPKLETLRWKAEGMIWLEVLDLPRLKTFRTLLAITPWISAYNKALDALPMLQTLILASAPEHYNGGLPSPKWLKGWRMLQEYAARREITVLLSFFGFLGGYFRQEDGFMNAMLYQLVAPHVVHLSIQPCQLPVTDPKDTIQGPNLEGRQVCIPILPTLRINFPRLERFSFMHESMSHQSTAWMVEMFHSFAAPLLEVVEMDIRLVVYDEPSLMALAEVLANRKAFPNLRVIDISIQMTTGGRSIPSNLEADFRARCPNIESKVTFK